MIESSKLKKMELWRSTKDRHKFFETSSIWVCEDKW